MYLLFPYAYCPKHLLILDIVLDNEYKFKASFNKNLIDESCNDHYIIL
jgi:hypothetical protein